MADAAVDGYSRWFVSRLKLLETTLEDREYLCSDRFTIADICVSYAITLADSLGIEQAFKPNIKRWTDMLFERAAALSKSIYVQRLILGLNACSITKESAKVIA